jgi:hypothetical protein
MIEMIASVPMRIDGRALKRGDKFKIGSKYAGLLKLTGRAEDVPILEYVVAAEYVVAKCHPIVAIDDEILEPAPRKKRAYRRRDMTAEQVGVADMAEHIAGGNMTRDQAEAFATGEKREVLKRKRGRPRKKVAE